MIKYKGFEYTTTKDSYEVFDFGKMTNQKISLASGSGIKDPDMRAKEKIDEIIGIVGLPVKC